MKKIIIAAIILIILGAAVFYWMFNPAKVNMPVIRQEDGPSASEKSAPLFSATDKTIVTINDFSFKPDNLTVHMGATVKWINNGRAPHTVVEDGGEFKSQYLSQGDTYSYTFNKLGLFSYYCSVHPSMKAFIKVIE